MPETRAVIAHQANCGLGHDPQRVTCEAVAHRRLCDLLGLPHTAPWVVITEAVRRSTEGSAHRG